MRGQGNFEIRPSEGKGLGMFATRDLVKGEMVVEERPVLVCDVGFTPDHMVEAVLQHGCSYLSLELQKEILALTSHDPKESPLWGRLRTNAFMCAAKWDPSADESECDGLYLTIAR